ncbi:hypothetical protein HY629_01315, partial [Candidatus Uhrbacteria bacterium]|nr:hypothetical protein [Candidatus Uhrbacteria bacterium]
TVLFLEALSTFEATVNVRFRLKKPFCVDTEIRMFGDPGKSVIVKPFTAGVMRPKEELASRFQTLGAIHGGYGGTCDAEPMWAIADSITPSLTSDLKEGRAKEFVFEITDGGSNGVSARAKAEDTAAQDTRNAVDAVEKVGVVARGFQIGEPAEEEKQTFGSIWGENGEHIPHPKDLAPAVAALLADELRKTEMKIQYYGEDATEAMTDA